MRRQAEISGNENEEAEEMKAPRKKK